MHLKNLVQKLREEMYYSFDEGHADRKLQTAIFKKDRARISQLSQKFSIGAKQDND